MSPRRRPTTRQKYGEKMGNPVGKDYRPSPAARGYDKHHRRWRKAILARDPICTDCGKAPSTVADHIVPIRQGGPRFDLENGAGMCQRCHNRKSAKEKAKFYG